MTVEELLNLKCSAAGSTTAVILATLVQQISHSFGIALVSHNGQYTVILFSLVFENKKESLSKQRHHVELRCQRWEKYFTSGID